MMWQTQTTIEYPFALRPASIEEAGLFYSQMDEAEDAVLGTVGHIRMDFGASGKEFYHTWWPHNGDQFNTGEFKDELQKFVDMLRADGPLTNLASMRNYCYQHGGKITEDGRCFGYIAETEHYRYCLRCTPSPGEYQGYLYSYDLRQQRMAQQAKPVGRITYAGGEEQTFTDTQKYLDTIREELQYQATTGFRYETLTDDPAVRKAVDDILLDFAGEENPRRGCNYGLTEAGKQALQEAADPDRPHTYAWFVMTDCNIPGEQIYRGLTLEEAIRTYLDSDRPEKRLGVTKDGNAVFVGIDEHGVARHAHKRGIYTQGKSYRGNVEGCDPRHSFHWTGTSDRLYVFEAPIDLLAFLTLYPEDWQQHSYVALCGTAEHAMLWMLEQNPKLQKIILCLDHDAAGIEAAGRLTDILCKHGYTQSAPLRSTNKDWDEDLKEQHGLEPQPPEEHPQLIVAGTICERIGAKCKAVRPEQASYQIPRLLQQYQNDLHWGRFEQAMDHMETMSALALSVVLRECRQMGTVLTEEQGARFLQSHIHPHQNRGSLKTRATEIGMEFQSVLAKDAVEGIRTEVEKKATASAWLELAISCAKVPIKYCADELRRQQKEEKALLEAAQAMASY